MNEDLSNKPKTNNIMLSFLVIMFSIFVIAGSVGVYFATTNRDDNNTDNKPITTTYYSSSNNSNSDSVNLQLMSDKTFKYYVYTANYTTGTGESNAITGTYIQSNDKITLTGNGSTCEMTIVNDRIASDCELLFPQYQERFSYDNSMIILFKKDSSEFTKMINAYKQKLISLSGTTDSGDSKYKYETVKGITFNFIGSCFGTINDFMCSNEHTLELNSNVNENTSAWLIPSADIDSETFVRRFRFVELKVDNSNNYSFVSENTSP